MPEMIAKVAQEYPVGTKRSPGEAFHVDQNHVRLLVAIGRVEYPAGEGAQEPKRRDLQAAAPIRYQTRALAASPSQKGPKKTRRRESLLAKAP